MCHVVIGSLFTGVPCHYSCILKPSCLPCVLSSIVSSDHCCVSLHVYAMPCHAMPCLWFIFHLVYFK